MQVPQDILELSASNLSIFAFQNFVEAANSVATSIGGRHGHLLPPYFASSPDVPPSTLAFLGNRRLVFKETDNKIPQGHVADTKCKPDITAAFAEHWEPETPMLWSCIQLAGKQASSGTHADQEEHAISYLHYMLLSRPDRHAVQALLTTKTAITFFFGIGGLGVRSFQVVWGSDGLCQSMCAFVYRLYEPGNFADPSYVDMKPDWENATVYYTINITVMSEAGGADAEESIQCPDFSVISARNPFETRTHVLSNPDSKVMLGNKRLTVLKDQLCRLGSRFNEHTILSRVHNPEPIPGVAEMVYSKIIEIPQFLGWDRAKYRTGLCQSGFPFASIPNLQQVLEVTFDTLEGTLGLSTGFDNAYMFAVLRNMRFERSIIHRDISKGNVLYTGNGEEDSTTSVMLSAKKGAPKQMRYCFIKYLLRERYVRIYCNWVAADTEPSDDPTATSVLLINFNNAEDLKSKENDQRTPRTVGCIPVTICDYAYLLCFRVHPSSLLVLFSEEGHWTSPATLEFSLKCPVAMKSTLRSIRIESEISRIKRKTCCMGLHQTATIANGGTISIMMRNPSFGSSIIGLCARNP